MRHATRSPQHGLSLVESVVTLGVVAGALQLGLPALDDMLQATALSSASQDLLMDLHLARMEAVKRNRRVAMCKSADGVQCTAAGGWEQGWIVFHDENNNGSLDAGEERIARREALAQPLRLRGNQPVADYISYTPLGVSRFAAGGFQAGTLTLCRASPMPTPARQVVLNAAGRPRVQKGTVASCDG